MLSACSYSADESSKVALEARHSLPGGNHSSPFAPRLDWRFCTLMPPDVISEMTLVCLLSVSAHLVCVDATAEDVECVMQLQ